MQKATDSGNISVEDRIESLIRLGDTISHELDLFNRDENDGLNTLILKAKVENPWFTERNVLLAMQNWANALSRADVNHWVEKYLPRLKISTTSITIGVVNAGNIPFVGLHDMLSVLLSGHIYQAKNATGDTHLLPYIANKLIEIEPAYKDRIHFVQKLEKVDAVIATGNNNSSRYFEYYFGKYPHIIRKNRNGVGLLDGTESKEELTALGSDIFSYFGLGCRNVSKLFVPLNYDFNNFFEAIYGYNEIMNHNKYMNNFDYNNSVYLLKQIKFLQNGFLIVTEEDRIASPVSVLFFEYYTDNEALAKNLLERKDSLQCIVSRKNKFDRVNELKSIQCDFGMTQSPRLWEYADGVDTLEFLCSM